MQVQNIVVVSIYVVVGIYILYRLFFKKNPYREDYEKLYNEVLTSKKYKVKGQWHTDREN